MNCARSTYYYEPKTNDEAELVAAIADVMMRWPRYGYRRIQAQLRREGVDAGERAVRRILKLLGGSFQVGRVRVRTTDSNHEHLRYSNLTKGLAIAHPDHVWVAEIVCTQMTNEVSDYLRSYVYVYIDPRNNQPFYIGKGTGNRLFSHLDDQSDSEKSTQIAEIRRSGYEPQVDILRYGLSDSEAMLVEAAAIDLLGKTNLTNRIAGHHHRSFGRISSQEIVTMLRATPAVITHKAILITINRLYRSDMSPIELYEATRGIWVLGKRRNNVEYAMAVYQGIVREVYQIKEWHPAGTLDYLTRESSHFEGSGRWEFSGTVAEDVRQKYVGYAVGKGGQNPIRYENA